MCVIIIPLAHHSDLFERHSYLDTTYQLPPRVFFFFRQTPPRPRMWIRDRGAGRSRSPSCWEANPYGNLLFALSGLTWKTRREIVQTQSVGPGIAPPTPLPYHLLRPIAART